MKWQPKGKIVEKITDKEMAQQDLYRNQDKIEENIRSLQ